MQTLVRLLSISKLYRWPKPRRCPWVQYARLTTTSVAPTLLLDQMDRLREQEYLTSVQCRMTRDRLAMYVDRNA